MATDYRHGFWGAHLQDGDGNELCLGLGDERIVFATHGSEELCLRCLGVALGLRPRDATEPR